jgi:hypothetical protein
MVPRPRPVTHVAWGGSCLPHLPTFCGALAATPSERSREPTCLVCIAERVREQQIYETMRARNLTLCRNEGP